ncbi:MAG: DEAD/DEAH box helicase [Actinomycetales bacterium]|nr:DEAD/DEAH box helicase [Actinomycetales bacterium]
MTVAPEPDHAPAEEHDAVSLLADRLVAAGRFVPGLTVDDDGRARSWWWPMPAADDRAALRALLPGAAVQAHRELADELAGRVDARVRRGLAGTPALPRRPGRRTLPELWLLSLADEDPWLPEAADPARARALAAAVADWVRSGRVAAGRLGLCLRVHEPPEDDAGPAEAWRVEVLVTDESDEGLRIPMDQWWPRAGTYGADAGRGLLADLARATRVAPELARLLDEAVPAGVDLDEASVASLLSQRVEPLTELGVTVLLPAWWTGRRRVGLRARAKTRSSGAESAVTAAGFGLEELVEFEWQAALGDLTLTRKDLKELSAAAAARRHLVRVRGQWVEVRPGDLDAVLARVGRRERAAAGQLLRAGLGIESFGSTGDVEVHGVTATGWLGDLLDQALHSRIRPIATPDGFVGTLRPYQARGVGWLTFLGRLGLGACLADDMGLGKTAQLIGSLLADPAGGPTLVVCPVSVLGSWERELAHFAPGLRVISHHGTERDPRGLQDRVADADVVLTTYSLVHRDIEALESVDWARLVLDEAQQVKNSGTSQAKAVRRLRAGRRVALTGTPVENRLAELWSIMNVLSPGLLGSSREFRERFAIPIERDQDEEATRRLQGITRPFVLRRLKSDKDIAPDLPAKVERTDRCPLTREQAVLYQAVVDELLETADSSEGMDRRGAVLAGLTKLKQVCNHPALLLGDGSALGGRSGKLTRIEELVEEVLDSGERALAFTQYATWGDMLAPYLSARFGTEVLWLHGSVPRPRRDAMVAAFQGEDGPPLMLISLRAGGTGLTLTRATHVIHLDRWWNPAVEDQATDRAHRIGQSRSVFVHRLISAGTVEERIDEMITRKRSLAQRVVGTGEAWLTDLSTADLRDAVALRPDAEED